VPSRSEHLWFTFLCYDTCSNQPPFCIRSRCETWRTCNGYVHSLPYSYKTVSCYLAHFVVSL